MPDTGMLDATLRPVAKNHCGKALLPPRARQIQHLPTTSRPVHSMVLDTGTAQGVPGARYSLVFSKPRFLPNGIDCVGARSRFSPVGKIEPFLAANELALLYGTGSTSSGELLRTFPTAVPTFQTLISSAGYGLRRSAGKWARSAAAIHRW